LTNQARRIIVQRMLKQEAQQKLRMYVDAALLVVDVIAILRN